MDAAFTGSVPYLRYATQSGIAVIMEERQLRRANRRVIVILVAIALAIYVSSFFLLAD